MKASVRELLPEFVLGLLPDDQMAQLAAVIECDPALQAEVEDLRLALTAPLEEVPPLQPSPEVRRRLMDRVYSGERYAPFLAPLGEILQLSVDKMRAVLARLQEPGFWEMGLPGIEMAHFDAGGTLSRADAGFVRFAAGSGFPRHRHIGGREITFVLEGTLLDDDRAYGPGAIVEREQGSVHAQSARTNEPLLVMVVHNGIEPVF
jgi:hypothetical protein